MSPSGNGPNLIDLTLRFDPERRNPDRFRRDPNDPDHVRPDPQAAAPERPIRDARVIADLFRRGNQNYARFIAACRTAAGKPTPPPADGGGEPDTWLFLTEREVARTADGLTQQDPYAAVLGCIDSRVPVELVTGQAADDVFVIRSAGNVLTTTGEASASLLYILDNYAVGSGNPHGHKTVRAVLVLGHTRCGAVDAAYEAFKPGGGGTAGLPGPLTALLREIKPAVEFVLGYCGLTDPVEIKDAISVVNAVYSHNRVKRMAEDAGAAGGLEVYYGTYDVTDFVLHKTNIPGFPDQKYAEAMSAQRAEKADVWSARGAEAHEKAADALARDAVEFARRSRR